MRFLLYRPASLVAAILLAPIPAMAGTGVPCPLGTTPRGVVNYTLGRTCDAVARTEFVCPADASKPCEWVHGPPNCTEALTYTICLPADRGIVK